MSTEAFERPDAPFNSAFVDAGPNLEGACLARTNSDIAPSRMNVADVPKSEVAGIAIARRIDHESGRAFLLLSIAVVGKQPLDCDNLTHHRATSIR